MKTCSKCKLEKDISEFGKRIASKDVLRPECKTCRHEYSISDKVKKLNNKYYNDNKNDPQFITRRKESNNRYYTNNKDDDEFMNKQRASSKQYYNNPKNKSKIRNRRLKKFGITSEVYDVMYKYQNGLCAICNDPETSIDYRTKQTRLLAVDHCHETNKVRKLLCYRCNTSIGKFKDDPDLLRAAAIYIEEHQPGLNDPPE